MKHELWDAYDREEFAEPVRRRFLDHQPDFDRLVHQLINQK